MRGRAGGKEREGGGSLRDSENQTITCLRACASLPPSPARVYPSLCARRPGSHRPLARNYQRTAVGLLLCIPFSLIFRWAARGALRRPTRRHRPPASHPFPSICPWAAWLLPPPSKRRLEAQGPLPAHGRARAAARDRESLHSGPHSTGPRALAGSWASPSCDQARTADTHAYTHTRSPAPPAPRTGGGENIFVASFLRVSWRVLLRAAPGGRGHSAVRRRGRPKSAALLASRS